MSKRSREALSNAPAIERPKRASAMLAAAAISISAEKGGWSLSMDSHSLGIRKHPAPVVAAMVEAAEPVVKAKTSKVPYVLSANRLIQINGNWDWENMKRLQLPTVSNVYFFSFTGDAEANAGH